MVGKAFFFPSLNETYPISDAKESHSPFDPSASVWDYDETPMHSVPSPSSPPSIEAETPGRPPSQEFPFSNFPVLESFEEKPADPEFPDLTGSAVSGLVDPPSSESSFSDLGIESDGSFVMVDPELRELD